MKFLRWMTVLSELHQRIQDTFNEFGVQIMSPNFENQPEQPVLSPKETWFAAPYKPAQGQGGAGEEA